MSSPTKRKCKHTAKYSRQLRKEMANRKENQAHMALMFPKPAEPETPSSLARKAFGL